MKFCKESIVLINHFKLILADEVFRDKSYNLLQKSKIAYSNSFIYIHFLRNGVKMSETLLLEDTNISADIDEANLKLILPIFFYISISLISSTSKFMSIEYLCPTLTLGSYLCTLLYSNYTSPDHITIPDHITSPNHITPALVRQLRVKRAKYTEQVFYS